MKMVPWIPSSLGSFVPRFKISHDFIEEENRYCISTTWLISLFGKSSSFNDAFCQVWLITIFKIFSKFISPWKMPCNFIWTNLNLLRHKFGRISRIFLERKRKLTMVFYDDNDDDKPRTRRLAPISCDNVAVSDF